MERWKGVIEPMIDQQDLTVSISGLERSGFETRSGEDGAEGSRHGGAPCYHETHVIRIGRWRGVILRTYDFATRTTTMRLVGHGNGSQALRAARRRFRQLPEPSSDEAES